MSGGQGRRALVFSGEGAIQPSPCPRRNRGLLRVANGGRAPRRLVHSSPFMRLIHFRSASKAAALAAASALFMPSAIAQVTFDVDSTADTPDAAPGDGVCADASGACSLRAAIQEANASTTPTVIQLQAGALYGLDRFGAGEDLADTGDLDVFSHVTILGRGATIDARGADRAFDVRYRYVLDVRDLALVNGSVVGESGGAIRNAGALLLDRCDVSASTAAGAGASGGAVFNDAGFVSVMRSRLSGCSATRAGGAIEANGGVTKVISSELTGNSTGPMPGNGGGLHITGVGTVEVRSTLVEDNSADREGGGLWNSAGGMMSVVLCEVRGNDALGTAADNGGGGLFNDGGLLEVRLCDVRDNHAPMGSGSGGGLFNNGGDLFLSLSNVEGNTANRAGGGVGALGGNTELFASQLVENTTGPMPGNGGGLHLTGAGTVSVLQCFVERNTATAEGGGLWNSAVGTLDIAGCSITGNRASGAAADQGGGGVFSDGGATTIARSLIAENEADGAAGSGGGVLNNLGQMTISDTRIIANSCSRAGGGVEAVVGTTRLVRVSLVDNVTGPTPGNGGGLHLTGAGLVEIDRSTVLGNLAANEGGGLWNSATGTMVVTLTAIAGNMAPVGPEVFNQGGTFTIDGVPVP